MARTGEGRKRVTVQKKAAGSIDGMAYKNHGGETARRLGKEELKTLTGGRPLLPLRRGNGRDPAKRKKRDGGGGGKNIFHTSEPGEEEGAESSRDNVKFEFRRHC